MSPRDAPYGVAQWALLSAESELLRDAAEKTWCKVALVGIADPAAASMEAALIHYQAAWFQRLLTERARLVALQAQQAPALPTARAMDRSTDGR